MVLDKLGTSLRKAVSRLRGRPVVDESAINEFLRDVQRALLEADVNVKLVLELSKRVKERALKEDAPPGFSRRELAVKILYEELTNLLGRRPAEIEIDGKRTNVILVVGIEGSGKTTTVAKLAHWFSKRYGKVAIVSSDVIRPASKLQLEQMVGGEIPVFWEDHDDPVRIMRDGLERFRKEKYNIVIVDTAGRHKEEEGLMKELREYYEAVKPDMVILVVDGTIGQAAYNQAKAFADSIPIGGVIVTKLDGAAKGGGALSAVAAAGAPIYFIGTGEKLDDLERFDPDRFVSRLLGGGDIVELARRMEEAFKESELLDRISKGKFDLEDFREYLQQLRKAGPLDKLLEMIPGVGGRLSNLEFDPKEMDRWMAIINSMTPEERREPSLIRGSRVERIARGSGVTAKDVRRLLKSYNQVKRMMESMSSPAKMRRLMRRMGLGA
ncbi:MAG: signal recognition particle receptor subunit alpha [Candidatus Korarchaeota archaeon]|nr:signal recognition particle receptor subunit alpha [Candidatus Korarchaeota archaeon]